MDGNRCGRNLTLIGTAVALHLSKALNATQMNILGALLNVIGDQLSLLAATAVVEQERDAETPLSCKTGSVKSEKENRS